jgi:hypothetical protein
MSDRDSEPQPQGYPQAPPVGQASVPVQGGHHASGEGDHGHGEHEQVRQMEDRPNIRSIFLIAVIGIVVTVVSIYISWGFQLHQEAQLNSAPVPAAVPGTYEAQGNAGIIERHLFPDRAGEVANGDAQQLRRAQEAQLSTYGWVDRPRGLIRIPIKQAMDQVIQAYGQRK